MCLGALLPILSLSFSYLAPPPYLFVILFLSESVCVRVREQTTEKSKHTVCQIIANLVKEEQHELTSQSAMINVY